MRLAMLFNGLLTAHVPRSVSAVFAIKAVDRVASTALTIYPECRGSWGWGCWCSRRRRRRRRGRRRNWRAGADVQHFSNSAKAV